MHLVILFNKNLISCNYFNLKINELRNTLTEHSITNGYFYMQWFFPVLGRSKWHSHTPEFKKSDLKEAIMHQDVLDNILTSAKQVLYIFDLNIVNDSVVHIDNFRAERDYWLRGIGHEEKKISRIALCLYYFGYVKTAESLLLVSIELIKKRGFKTKIDTNKVVDYWGTILNDKIVY